MAVEAAQVLTPSAISALPTGWSWKRLDSVCDGIFDCPHSTPVLTEFGPLVARSQDIRTGAFRAEEAAHVSDEVYQDRVARAEPKYGDLLYSREGTYFGIAAEVPPDARVCLGQRMVLLRPKADEMDTRFLRYWLNSPVMSRHVHGFRDGTVAERLNLPTIRALPVAVPPLAGQRVIAHILGTLDDKIELNRRMDETLETIARAIFKSWFVDFDPVLAKAEGRDPGLPKHIADLFPDRFEYSQLGEIPAGWQVRELSEVTAQITKGTTPTQEELIRVPISDRQINYLRVNAIADDGSISYDKLTKIPETVHNGVLKRSILRANDVVYTIAGTIGRVAVVEDDLLPANTNQAVAIIRLKPGLVPPDFLVLTLRQQAFHEELHSKIVHAVQPNLSLGMISRAKAIFPPIDALNNIFKPIQALLRKASTNRRESRTLAALCDALLPKLLSGELRVKTITESARATA